MRKSSNLIPSGDLCENWPDGQCPFWAEEQGEGFPDTCTNPELIDGEVRPGRQRTFKCLRTYPYGGTVTIERGGPQ